MQAPHLSNQKLQQMLSIAQQGANDVSSDLSGLSGEHESATSRLETCIFQQGDNLWPICLNPRLNGTLSSQKQPILAQHTSLTESIILCDSKSHPA